MIEKLQAVIAANRAVLQRARDLNARAGEHIFRVMSRAEWEAWLLSRIGNAVSAATIPDIEMLRLPNLDPTLVAEIFRKNPDTIEVLGREVDVNYDEYGTPQVVITDILTNHRWKDLPDKGIKLPSGKLVEVGLKIGYGDIVADSDIPALKEKMRNRLNRQQWDRWPEHKRPMITIPDFSREDTQLPEIMETSYGTCVVDGTPLICYGTIVANYSWLDRTTEWKTTWFQNRSDAEFQKTRSKVYLEDIRIATRKIQEKFLEEVRAKEALQKIQSFSNREGWSSISLDLQDNLRRVVRKYPGHNLGGASAHWLEIANPIITETEAEFVKIQQREKTKEEVQAKAGHLLLELLQAHYAVCPICGEKQLWDLERAEEAVQNGQAALSCACDYQLEAVEQAQELIEAADSGFVYKIVFNGSEAIVIRHTSAGEEVLIEAVAFYYKKHWNLVLAVHPEAIVKNEHGEISTKMVWHKPTELEEKIAELEWMREEHAKEVRAATKEMADGYVRKLRFKKGMYPKTRTERWESISTEVKGITTTRVTHIANPGSIQMQEDRWYFCRLDRTLGSTESFKVVTVEIFLEAELNFEQELASLRKEKEVLEAVVPV